MQDTLFGISSRMIIGTNMEKVWEREANTASWSSNGMLCYIRRNTKLGYLLGYVGVSPGHPLYGKDYEHLGNVHVHGGLNYSGHLPGQGQVWFFGFDCGQTGDWKPYARANYEGDKYRDIQFVTQEVQMLKGQLIEITKTLQT